MTLSIICSYLTDFNGTQQMKYLKKITGFFKKLCEFSEI